MKKLWLFIGLSAVLQILCGREEEWKFDFEKPSLPLSVTKDLFQNKAPVFKPYGTVQIVEASFEKQKKAAKFYQGSHSCRSKHWETIAVQALLQANKGTVLFYRPQK